MKHGHRFLIGALVAMVLAVALALLAAGGRDTLAAGVTIYVDADADGANDGSSWGNAFTTLQAALDEALSDPVDEIWVAEGTYKPTEEHGGSGDRYKSFQLINGVAIYGGFDPPDDDTWEERDWEAHPTILSGDLNDDDGPDFANNDENSYHVFYHPGGTNLDGSAILDGFSITGGNANGGWPHYIGGGMYNYASSPKLSNCAFSGNLADHGGGIYNEASSPTLTNCTFEANSSTRYGGGMRNEWWSSPTLTDCIFSDNSAGSTGGGMFNSASSPTLTDCIFSDNSAGSGGGMGNGSYSSPQLTNCTFSGNSSVAHGGGMHNDGSSPILANCTFSGNSAGYNVGGGIYNRDSSPALTNCTFAGNSAREGGGMFNEYYSSPTLTNCILWASTPDEIFNYDADSTPVVTYSDIQGGYPGDGNIDAAPLFADAANGDFHLLPDSLCIDAGNPYASNLPPYDFEGDPRVLDGDGDGTFVVDMGVDEVVYSGPPVLEVEIDIRPDSDQNVINLGSGGVVPVAILTTAEFDAATVRPGSVRFAGAQPRRWTLEDVDRDGDLDLLLSFRIRELELGESSTDATLTGETFPHAGGVLIEGTDTVRIIP